MAIFQVKSTVEQEREEFMRHKEMFRTDQVIMIMMMTMMIMIIVIMMTRIQPGRLSIRSELTPYPRRVSPQTQE